MYVHKYVLHKYMYIHIYIYVSRQPGRGSCATAPGEAPKSGEGFKVWGLRFAVWRLRSRVSGCGVSDSGVGFRVQDFGLSDWGLGFTVWGFVRVQGFG